MKLVTYLIGWFDGWSAAGGRNLNASGGTSAKEWPTQSAWIQLEGSLRSGRLAVWENGQIDLEIYDNSSAEPVLLRSSNIQTVEALVQSIKELLESVAND